VYRSISNKLSVFLSITVFSSFSSALSITRYTMNRSHLLDNEADLPSLRRPTAWELSGGRRRPYTTNGITPRTLPADNYGRMNYPLHHHQYHRQHVGATTRDELLYPPGDARHQMLEVTGIAGAIRDVIVFDYYVGCNNNIDVDKSFEALRQP
jgi:hypothetical protein